jgi:hypothetical protein
LSFRLEDTRVDVVARVEVREQGRHRFDHSRQ